MFELSPRIWFQLFLLLGNISEIISVDIVEPLNIANIRSFSVNLSKANIPDLSFE